MFKRENGPFLSRCLHGWRVRIGRDPRHVRPGTVILFPVTRATLPCGLSGIITIKPKTSEQPPGDAITPSSLFDRIRGKDLRSLLAESTPPEGYLGGSICCILLMR